MQALQPDKTSLQRGRYQIKKVLGTGSFGITYLATTRVRMQAAINGSLGSLVQDQEVEVKVCIKEFFMRDVNRRGQDGTSVEGTLNTLYTNYRKRFRKEAENLSKLTHPNIVKVLEVFDENGTTYYVMQYVEGETLDDYIKHHMQGHLAEGEARGMISTIARALQYMHEKRMLHLDLKPKNIMLAADGTPYVIDFGLSKQYDENGEPESSTAIGLGTPGYAPTEQADYIPDGTFPATLDVYALGATLYKMLTGKTPPTANEVLNNGIPTRPSHVSEKMWRIVEKAMQPRKKDRPQSIAEFMALFDAPIPRKGPENGEETEVPVVPNPIPNPKPLPKPKPTPNPRSLWPYLASVVGVILCVGLGIFLTRSCDGTDVDEPSEPSILSESESAVDSQTITANGVSFKMVRVEGGTFTMGATSEQESDAYGDEKPAHRVTLSTYYIGETEVTQALWEAVMGTTVSQQRDLANKEWPLRGVGSNYPMYYISWNDCKTFISKLNSITKKNFRLPTEAEWEFAARGGNKSQSYKYSGSNTLGNVAWYPENSGSDTHPVKTKSPNELGLYDMSGNVWEWCQDWKGSYESSSQTNPTGPSSGSDRVRRGGSWGYIAGSCRVSLRGSRSPDYRDSGLGLRLAL